MVRELVSAAPLRLYLSVARDFTSISEYRMLVSGRRVSRRSAGLRGRQATPETLAAFVERVCSEIAGPLTLDIACLSDGSLWVVEINPTGPAACLPAPDEALDLVVTGAHHAAWSFTRAAPFCLLALARCMAWHRRTD